MYHIIVNKKSRSGRGEKLWPVIEGELERRRTEFRVYPTKYHGSARETAARLTAKGVWNPDDVLLAIGGDGTANEAVDGIPSLSDVKFGLFQREAATILRAVPEFPPIRCRRWKLC